MAKLRIGLQVNKPNSQAVLDTIVQAENNNIDMVWSTFGGVSHDNLSIYTAAAVKTSKIRFGTSIVPTYTRHPSVLASQALALEGLAPGRLRLGIGPSHRPSIEGNFGIPMGNPHEQLREYLTVLRALLWEGKVDFKGNYFKINSTLPSGTIPPRTPVLISALRENAFRLAGEYADGAISWNCPVPYLIKTALPAMQAGAAAAGRPVPPLVAHVLVALNEDRQAVFKAGRAQLATYGKLPFYVKMFQDAGYEVGPDGILGDGLLDALIVSGDAGTVAARLAEIQAAGLSELLIAPVFVGDAASEQSELLQLLGQV
jgi:F420-dependent oxidoreductase-like protein